MLECSVDAFLKEKQIENIFKLKNLSHKSAVEIVEIDGVEEQTVAGAADADAEVASAESSAALIVGATKVELSKFDEMALASAVGIGDQ